MPLTSGYILRDAFAGGYAVPAFSVHSEAMVDAILAEVDALRSPVLLQIGQRAIRNGQMQVLAQHIARSAQNVRIPVVIHLDHCHQFDQVVQSLRAGFTSCMMDASSLPYSDNVQATAAVVNLCHAVDVPVEGELGAIGGVEDDVAVADEDAVFTAPDAAEKFVSETGVDSLAVAIGSAHGMYRREPKLRLDLLREIRAATGVPLVLHGGSGIPREQIEASIQLGIAKINFDTELRLAYMAGWRAGATSYPDDPFSAQCVANEALRQVVRDKVDWCGSAQRV
ncbi:class II fructose-bisphosphate aldolase [Alicyclobacillus kakegawensis]|uniref:class II fructose-bisphosphate aldolase n=1 Tax=Alicyclobacillus kakegawensis TaxID=392012 RepID=UPI000835A8AF|nr:class II fructose-bisphosphate aldolase [Alicyclobacillus kakegawensis]